MCRPGGGIVADWVPALEWEEILNKRAAMLPALLRWLNIPR